MSFENVKTLLIVAKRSTNVIFSAGNFENFEKNFGKKLRNLEKNISRFIVFELEIFTNISNFLNLEILELFRYLKSSKCL